MTPSDPSDPSDTMAPTSPKPRPVRRTASFAVLAAAVALVATVVAVGPRGGAPIASSDEPPAAPPAAAPVQTKPDLEGAIRKGIAYLVTSQNKDGSWGSPASNLWDIYAPVPGSYYAFAEAASALALSALLEVGGKEPGVDEAVRRATEYVLAKHGVKRVAADTLYNVWAQAYAIEAFARLCARETDEARKAVYRKAMADEVDLLGKFACVDLGWGYYDFDAQTQRPSRGQTSFTTATVLVALEMAKAQGVAVPDALVKAGVDGIHECAKPDGAYFYGYYLKYHPQMGINKVKGSLGRTSACLLALDYAGEKATHEKVVKALDDLEKEGRFLLIARKYPFPHETWYQNSGYFCFYGYYYATWLMEHLPVAERVKYQDQIAGHLVPLQEQDGSFWDYQLYSYHKAYGTGYMLMTLARCRHG